MKKKGLFLGVIGAMLAGTAISQPHPVPTTHQQEALAPEIPAFPITNPYRHLGGLMANYNHNEGFPPKYWGQYLQQRGRQKWTKSKKRR